MREPYRKFPSLLISCHFVLAADYQIPTIHDKKQLRLDWLLQGTQRIVIFSFEWRNRSSRY